MTFEEATTVFDDLHAYYERDRSSAELRVAVTGYSSLSRMLFVVFVEVGDDVVRVISARKATPHERQKYQKSQSKA